MADAAEHVHAAKCLFLDPLLNAPWCRTSLVVVEPAVYEGGRAHDGRTSDHSALEVEFEPPQDNGSGNLGLRVGDWKLVRLEKRGKTQAMVSPNERPLPSAKHTLYRLSSDSGEPTDVSASHPEMLPRLTAQLDKIINDGRSRGTE